jgi:hypothetical protein
LAHMGFAQQHKPTQANPKRANFPYHVKYVENF